MDDPRFLTLTVRANTEPLDVQVRRLHGCFRALRATTTWKKHVEGGAATIECKYTPGRDTWHVHLHAIVDGGYWPQAEIADLWGAITGGSRIVDIRRISSRKGFARYVSGYICKAAGIEKWPSNRIIEYAETLHGSRLLTTFGSCHGVSLDPVDANVRHGPRRVLCTLGQFDVACVKRAPRALAAAKLLRDLQPHVGRPRQLAESGAWLALIGHLAHVGEHFHGPRLMDPLTGPPKVEIDPQLPLHDVVAAATRYTAHVHADP